MDGFMSSEENLNRKTENRCHPLIVEYEICKDETVFLN